MEPIKARKTVLISPANNLTFIEVQKWAKSLLWFTAPALAIFFGQLAVGVDIKVAGSVALLAFWGAAADLFKKYRDQTVTVD